MNRVIVVALGLVLCSIPVLAGEFLLNEEVAYGLRVTFSEPVTITHFGDVLMTVAPQREATQFVFSGAKLPAWVGHGIVWQPATAQISSYQWLSLENLESAAPADAIAEDFTYAVDLVGAAGGTTLTIERHVERNCLPFSVRYDVVSPVGLDQYVLSWDLDKYVDSDGDGDPQNDADEKGSVLDLLYVENYNPTVTLQVLNSDGTTIQTWENMVRNDYSAETLVRVDGRRLAEYYGLQIDPTATLTWQQVHMDQNSLEYMTEYSAPVEAPGELTSAFLPRYAGRYVYELGAEISAGLETIQAAAWVVEEATGAARKLGLVMSDVWNDWIDSEGNRLEECVWFSDDEAVATLRYLGSVGFDSIDVFTGVTLENMLPLPSLTSEAPNVPSDSDLMMVLAEIADPALSIQSFVSLRAEPYEEIESSWRDFTKLTRAYFESYFQQRRPRTVELADLAEEFQVSNLFLAHNESYIWGLGAISDSSPSTARYVAEQWVELIEDVRSEFSGQISISCTGPETPSGRPLAGKSDHINFNTNSFCFWGDCSYARIIEATTTAEELRSALAGYYRSAVQPRSIDMGAPISFILDASSYLGAAREFGDPGREQAAYVSWRDEFALGGYGDEILNGDAMAPFQPSFRDQVLLLETFIPVLASQQTTHSIWLWGQYWEILDFEDFAPEHELELHSANSASLQGKPGFQVARLWASILTPNDRLLYRKVLPLPEPPTEAANAAPGVQASTLASLPNDMPIVLIDDFADGNLISELGVRWTFSEFGGTFVETPSVSQDAAGDWYLEVKQKSPYVGVGVQLSSSDLTSYDVLILDVSAPTAVWLNVGLDRIDSSLPTGGLGFDCKLRVDAGRREYTLPLSGFAALPSEIALCPDCGWEGGLSDIDFIYIAIDADTSGEIAIYEVRLERDHPAGAEAFEPPLADGIVAPGTGLTDLPSDAAVDLPENLDTPALPGLLPDWTNVNYVRSYDVGHNNLRSAFANGQQISTSLTRFWGLPGSEIKGLKCFYEKHGLFVLLELWEPNIRGDYRYEFSFSPQSSRYTPFTISVDPVSAEVSAWIWDMDGESDIDVSYLVQLVLLEEDSLVVYMADAELPGGASVTSTRRQWTRDIVCHYDSGSTHESYVLQRFVDIRK